MTETWTEKSRRVLMQEILADKGTSITTQEWFALKAEMMREERERERMNWEESRHRELNGYDAAAVKVFRLLLETDVRIVKNSHTIRSRISGTTCEEQEHTVLAHDALWVVSLASCVKTRQLQIVATTWGNQHYPRPGKNYVFSPVVVNTYGVPIPEWLAEYTY